MKPIIDWIKALKARHEIQVKIIRCDNVGEDKVLGPESDNNDLGIIFEYTAPGTPLRNGVVERAFVTVMGCVRAMQGSPWLRGKNCGGRQLRLQHYWIIFWYKTVPKVPCLLSFLEWMQSMPTI